MVLARKLMILMVISLLIWPMGCTKLIVEDGPPPGNTQAVTTGAGVHFSAYRFKEDARSGQPYDDGVLTQLWVLRGERYELIHRDTQSTWTRDDLIPGQYVLEILEIYDGAESDQPNEDSRIAFEVEAGGVADVDLILKKVPWGKVAVVTLGVVVVVGVVAYVVATQEFPDRGFIGPLEAMAMAPNFTIRPPPLIVPQFNWALWHPFLGPGHRLYIALDVIDALSQPVYWQRAYHRWDPKAPKAISFNPPIEGHEALWVGFDRAMEGFYFDPHTVQIRDGQGQIIPASVYYEAHTHRMSLRPLAPLSPGDYEFILYGELVVDSAGVPMGQNLSWPFTVEGPSLQ